MVEIAKALGHKPRLLILDEATSALTAADVEKVYGLLARLKSQGVAILYISHRMHEVDALADRASVFRNGRHIETFDKGARSTAEIVQLMIGRDIAQQYPMKPPPKPREPAMRVENLNWENKLTDISLEIGAGEIVGIGGLDGQGQKMLLLALFGVLKGVGGRIEVNGRPVRMGSPAHAKSRDIGVALVPEDRKTEGLMLAMSIGENLTLASLGALASGPFIDRAKEAQAIKHGVERLRIKIGAPEDPVSTLSGGNQQKVVVAKWLMTEPRVVLFNDPTRGIDVGAKQEIYRLMRELADQGAAILFYSTDYDELIGCCDRVAIMYDGRIVRELKGAEITETNIVTSSLNVEEAAHV
jgi:ribose transport system ATP-binding protein